MPNPIQITPNGGRAPDPNAKLAYAKVSPRQPAPSSFSDPLFVVFDYDPDTALTINQWPAIHGATLPAIGADVLLAHDSNNNWRIIWWAGDHS